MEKDQMVKVGVIAGGVIFGAIVLKYLFSETDDQRIQREIKADMKKLAHLSKDPSGIVKV